MKIGRTRARGAGAGGDDPLLRTRGPACRRPRILNGAVARLGHARLRRDREHVGSQRLAFVQSIQSPGARPHGARRHRVRLPPCPPTPGGGSISTTSIRPRRPRGSARSPLLDWRCNRRQGRLACPADPSGLGGGHVRTRQPALAPARPETLTRGTPLRAMNTPNRYHPRKRPVPAGLRCMDCRRSTVQHHPIEPPALAALFLLAGTTTRRVLRGAPIAAHLGRVHPFWGSHFPERPFT